MEAKISNKGHLIFIVLFYSVLSLGCFWQIFNVCELYFKYPTNIFIETKFEPLSKPLPALTFCANIGNNSGNLSSEALEFYSTKFKYEMFKSIIIKGDDGKSTSMKEDYLSHAIERISLQYYCITINSILTGSFK